MASGDTLFTLFPVGSVPPATLFATLDTVTETSTPNATITVLDFDGATSEYADWLVQVPSHYDGGGMTFSFKYAMSSTDGSSISADISVRKQGDTEALTQDTGLDTATPVEIDDDPSTTADDFNYTATGNLSHANCDSPATGDYLIIRFQRDTADAADTNADDLQLAAIYVTET